jgi:hypothetical protein
MEGGLHKTCTFRGGPSSGIGAEKSTVAQISNGRDSPSTVALQRTWWHRKMENSSFILEF